MVLVESMKVEVCGIICHTAICRLAAELFLIHLIQVYLFEEAL